MKADTVYLQHIYDATTRIAHYLGDTERDEFYADLILQDAIVRQLQIIGEATRILPKAFKQKHPEIPWEQIIGMRNRIIHEYFRVDLEIVWEVIQNDLPDIARQITTILADSTTPGK
ncbi:MAG: DUF86 domain-containing protein [Caldilineaceae bacterium]|jgi:uncharacterized protein with HEPN domain